MSLFSTFTDANKRTDALLQVRYSVRKVPISGTWGGHYYEVHRYATKSYAYIGMTKTAATACQAAKVSQYTVTTRQWEYDSTTGNFVHSESTSCMADISASPNGSAWEVSISVNEDDCVLSRVSPANPASLFSYCDSRDYDEDDDDEEEEEE